VEPPRDPEVDHDEELVLELDDDTLSHPTKAGDSLLLELVRCGRYGSKQQGTPHNELL
jgi:hypothetical protein